MNQFFEACALGALFFGGHTLLASVAASDIQPWATAIAGGICTIGGAFAWVYERFVKPRRQKAKRKAARRKPPAVQVSPKSV